MNRCMQKRAYGGVEKRQGRPCLVIRFHHPPCPDRWPRLSRLKTLRQPSDMRLVHIQAMGLLDRQTL